MRKFMVVAIAASCSHVFAQWQGPSGPQNLLFYNGGNGYIGTPGLINPVVRFDVVDNAQGGQIIGLHSYIATPQNGERTTAMWGETNNPAGRALQGFNFANTGSGAGVWAETACPTGTGLRARATSATGASYAAYFDAASGDGTGVYSSCTALTGTGVAVRGSVGSSDGFASYFTGGIKYFDDRVGIGTTNPLNRLTATGSSATSVALGNNTSTDSGSASSGPSGVAGQMSASISGAYAAGVRGYSLGSGISGIGVLGYHAGSGFGVYGVTSNVLGFAGYFEGKLGVTGLLSKGAGSFKIDHPLDPENKYLYHSFVESPDMMNIYNGLITTDGEGYATVEMPEWFDALNREFRYQLTVIDESDAGWVLAKVVRKMYKNQFTIRTNYPHVEVSWQVTGVRQDKFAQANRIPVEVEKEAWNKGRYLHPSAFGKSADLQVSYQVDEKGNAVSPLGGVRGGDRRGVQGEVLGRSQELAAPPEQMTQMPPLTPAVRSGR